jgi:hypothetical protein
MTNNQEIVRKLVLAQKEPIRLEYKDEKTDIVFHIVLPYSFEDFVRLFVRAEQEYEKYKNFIVDDELVFVSRETFDMCCRLETFVKEPKLSLDDWLYISFKRADLIINLSQKILEALNSDNENFMKLMSSTT